MKSVRLSPEMCAAVRGFWNGPGARVSVAASQWQGNQDEEGGQGLQSCKRKMNGEPEQSSPSARAKQPPTNDAKVGGGLWNETMFCCPPDVH